MKQPLLAQLDILLRSIQKVDPVSLEKLHKISLRTVKGKKKIIISALGKGAYVAQKTVASLLSLGIDSSFLHANDALHGDVGQVGKDDLVIILTKSGNTSETINLIKLIATRNKNIWIIHCNKNSEVAKTDIDQVYIPLEHEGDLWDRMPMNSTLVFFLILNQMVIELSKSLGIRENDFLLNHPSGGVGSIAISQQ